MIRDVVFHVWPKIRIKDLFFRFQNTKMATQFLSMSLANDLVFQMRRCEQHRPEIVLLIESFPNDTVLNKTVIGRPRHQTCEIFILRQSSV